MNLRHDPEVSIEVGGRVVNGQARIAASDRDYEEAFSVWRNSQPRVIRAVYRIFGFKIGDSDEEQRRLMRQMTLVIVRLAPR